MSRIGVKKWNPVGKMDWPEIHAFKRELHDLGIWNPYKWSPVCKMSWLSPSEFVCVLWPARLWPN